MLSMHHQSTALASSASASTNKYGDGDGDGVWHAATQAEKLPSQAVEGHGRAKSVRSTSCVSDTLKETKRILRTRGLSDFSC